jgi:hypothetical protein
MRPTASLTISYSLFANPYSLPLLAQRGDLFLAEPLAASVVEVELVVIAGPDGAQPDIPRPAKDELHAAPLAEPRERDFLERKLFGDEVFVPAERLMDVLA